MSSRPHSRPQSPSFLSHVVGKRGALEAAVTGCQKISDTRLRMCRTDFCPSPLHWGKDFTLWALSREWLFWDVLKMHHFTQLGFTDNLELKEEDSDRNWMNALLVCRTETINRQTIVWVTWVFFFFFFNTFGEQTLGTLGKSQSKKVSCSMSCNCYLTSKRLSKRNHSCVVLGE